MIKLSTCIMALGVTLLAVSCGPRNHNQRNIEARGLYEKSLQIGLQYSDSIRNAKDSAEVERLSKSYEEMLTKLNYTFPPDLDLEISEGENDTLISVAQRYVFLRDSVLTSFAQRRLESVDSLENMP